jgi:hypothetical protein
MTTCQCCGASAGSWITMKPPFLVCGNCGVFRNTNDLLKGGPPDTNINTAWPLMRGDIEKSFRIIDRLEMCTSDRFLYDVAGSYGYLTWAALRKGWVAFTQDIDLGAARAAKEMFGIDIQASEFEGIDLGSFKGSFVFNHGIEHLRSPDKAIAKAIEHLSPNGVIFLAHPCIPEGRAKELVCNSHQYEWTFDSFGKFLAQFSLRVLRSEHTDFDGDGTPSQTWIVDHPDLVVRKEI